MKGSRIAGLSLLAMAVGWGAPGALARATPEQVAQLGGDRTTCSGAERAGTPDGVAAYSGRWLDSWPGMQRTQGYDPGPYADEKPLFTITAANMAQYADRLSEGQKALLRKQPQDFRIPVYPSHRDFRPPDWVCDVVRKNALSAAIINEGLGTSGTTGAHPFPFPKNGLEAIWNVILPHRIANETAVTDVFGVYPNGSRQHGRQFFRTLSAFDNPARRSANEQEPFSSYISIEFIEPAREAGMIAVGRLPMEFSGAGLMGWMYHPGTRRMRQLPSVGFDYPSGPGGLITSDDDSGFNGSPERYRWKLLGKKAVYVPYNNFRINDPALRYEQLVGAKTVNPELLRYELHRVWVIEGTLKPGLRHVYKKRVLYADEDTWQVALADNSDNRDQLWRTTVVTSHYAPAGQAYHRGATFFTDLLSGSYVVQHLVNESPRWWAINDPAVRPELFDPKTLVAKGR